MRQAEQIGTALVGRAPIGTVLIGAALIGAALIGAALIGAALIGAALIGTAWAAEPGEIAEYTARYEVEYNGRHVANAEFSVTRQGDRYLFESSAKARFLLRLAQPNPAVERSEFGLEDDRLVPERFVFEDGSRRGEDSYRIEFDAAAGQARIQTAGGEQTVPFERGLLDRGSLQVALMHDLARCVEPESYRLVGDDGIVVYDYERLENRSAETGLGTIEAERFRQQRAGSSRATIVWVAPELAFVPVRIEQMRNGEIETVFLLDDLDGLEPRASGCRAAHG